MSHRTVAQYRAAPGWVHSNPRLATASGYNGITKHTSCAGTDRCDVFEGGVTIGPGDLATVECNGVRDENIPDSQQTLAYVQCEVFLYATY